MARNLNYFSPHPSFCSSLLLLLLLTKLSSLVRDQDLIYCGKKCQLFLASFFFLFLPGKCYLITKGKADIMIKFRFFTSCFGDILIRMFSFFTPLKIHLSVITSVPEKLEPKIPFYLLLSCYRCCWTIIYYHLRCITIIISSVAGR